MNEIQKLDTVYLEGYDIHVNKYLTYAQIQQIVDAVTKFTTWAERQQNIDMLILYHATDIGKEKLKEIGVEAMLEAGVVYSVKNCIHNYYDIIEAISYTESVQRALSQIVKELPELTKSFNKVAEDNGDKK